jgi:hypothetical protein
MNILSLIYLWFISFQPGRFGFESIISPTGKQHRNWWLGIHDNIVINYVNEQQGNVKKLRKYNAMAQPSGIR